MENQSKDRTLLQALARKPEPVFNSEMLTLAREFIQLTKKELAEQVGVAPSFITDLEDGNKLPSAETLEKIARSTGFPIEHFFGKGRFESAPSSMFRKRKTIPQSVIRCATARIALLKRCMCDLLLEVDAPGRRLPRLDPDEVSGGVPAIAAMVRQALRIPDGPIRNLTGILEEHGVFVIPFDFGSLKIDGCSDWVADHPVILFNPNVSRSRLRHTLSHELGHLVMHDFILDEDQENQADAFAGCFNLPREQIASQLIPLNMGRLAGLKAHWKSSMGAILHRAGELGVISERQIRYFWMNLRKVSGHGEEPHEDLIPIERPRLLADLIHAFQESAVSSQCDIPTFLKVSESTFLTLFPINGLLRAV